LIIGNEGNEFIVSDGKGVYKTGEQIITSKVSTEVGEVAKTEIKSISFDDEEAIAQLEELQSAYPGAEIYLSGELGVNEKRCGKGEYVSVNNTITKLKVGFKITRWFC
jgi:inner membrane protein